MKGTKLDKETLPQGYKSASELCGGLQGKGRWLLCTTVEDHRRAGDATLPHFPAGAVPAGTMTSRQVWASHEMCDSWQAHLLLRWCEMKEDGYSWAGSVGKAEPSHYLNVLKKGKNSKRRRAKGWRDAQPIQTTHAGVEPCLDGPPSRWSCRAWVSKKHKLESYRGNMNVMHHQAVLTLSFHRSTSLLPLVSRYLKNTSISETVGKKCTHWCYLIWLWAEFGPDSLLCYSRLTPVHCHDDIIWIISDL